MHNGTSESIHTGHATTEWLQGMVSTGVNDLAAAVDNHARQRELKISTAERAQLNLQISTVSRGVRCLLQWYEKQGKQVSLRAPFLFSDLYTCNRLMSQHTIGTLQLLKNIHCTDSHIQQHSSESNAPCTATSPISLVLCYLAEKGCVRNTQVHGLVRTYPLVAF